MIVILELIEMTSKELHKMIVYHALQENYVIILIISKGMQSGAYNTTLGIENTQIIECPASYYCQPGTFIDIITSSSCPERYACVPGLPSLKEVYKYPCPKGRMCKDGLYKI
jgi:hypothetical protein